MTRKSWPWEHSIPGRETASAKVLRSSGFGWRPVRLRHSSQGEEEVDGSQSKRGWCQVLNPSSRASDRNAWEQYKEGKIHLLWVSRAPWTRGALASEGERRGWPSPDPLCKKASSPQPRRQINRQPHGRPRRRRPVTQRLRIF